MSRKDLGDARRRRGGARLDPRILDDIVRRVVEVARPERIVLFGSAARGEMGPHSDVDLLVVKEGADAHSASTGTCAGWTLLSTWSWSRPTTWSAIGIVTRS